MTYDFDGIVKELQDRLSLLSDWRQTLFYGVYQRIIEATAYAIDKLVYLNEFLYRESHWTTALKRKSLMLKAAFLVYTPFRKQAPNGNLIISGDSTGFFNNYTYTGETTIVPKWTKFTNTNGDKKVYCTTQTSYSKGAVISKVFFNSGAVTNEGSGTVGLPIASITPYAVGDTIKIAGTNSYNGYFTVTTLETNKIIITTTYNAETFDGTEYLIADLVFIPIKQGTPKTYTYIANGDTNEIITIFSDSVENVEIEVFIVNASGNTLNTVSIVGVDTTETKLFFLSDPDNYYCEISTASDFESVKIQFSDNIYAKQLSAGTRVLVKYAITDGEDGNITNTEIINTIDATLLGADGNASTLYVTNDQAISDGTEIESIENIRNNATNLYGTGYRCGGYSDWVEVLENHANIYKAVIWSTDDVADDTIATNQNKVFVSAISTDGDVLTSSQKSDIVTDYLKDKKSPTEIVSWSDPTIIRVMTRTTATIETVNKATVTNEIFTALDTDYGILNSDFKVDANESNVKSIIDNLSNIDYHTTEIYNCEYLNTNIKTNYPIAVYKEATANSNDIKLSSDSLELWVKTLSGTVWSSPDRIAYDSGEAWVVESGYLVGNSSIDYDTSQVSFNVSSGIADDSTTYQIYMSYKTKDGDGIKLDDVRLPSTNFITDVDEHFVFTETVSGVSTLTFKS